MRPISAVLVAVAMLALGCAEDIPTAPDRGNFVETHHSILEEAVRGAYGQRLPDVNVTVQFKGKTQFSPPTTKTDAAGEFLFVLALYNEYSVTSESVEATVHAVTSSPAYSIFVGAQAPVVVRFLPVSQPPPHASVELKLPVP